MPRNHKEKKQKKNQGVVQQMVRPPQSPDLDITESVWDYMKSQKTVKTA